MSCGVVKFQSMYFMSYFWEGGCGLETGVTIGGCEFRGTMMVFTLDSRLASD